MAGAPRSLAKLCVAATTGQHLGAGGLQRRPRWLHHRRCGAWDIPIESAFRGVYLQLMDLIIEDGQIV